MTDTDQRPAASADADPVADAVRVAMAVPGVASVRVDEDEDGAALLRLELHAGADEDDVARAVEEQLRRAAAAPVVTPVPDPVPGPASVPAAVPVAVHVPVVQLPAAPAATRPPEAAAAVPQQLGRPAGRPRTGRVPVPSVSSPTVAATPAPLWLDETPAAEDVPAAPAPEPAGGRLVLQRVQMATEGLTTTATVVLACGSTSHTGVADSAATPTGGQRALATATVRALESAAGGRLRAEVDAVSVADLAGRPTALVQLSMVTAGGPEQLVGAALTAADASGGVVRAVLAACNRRVVPPTTRSAPDPAAERGRTRR